MQAVKYKFEDHVKIAGSNYIFQSVSERKLSDIYHTHGFYELILLLCGGVSHHVNDSDIPMKAGDCIILTPKDAHSFTMQTQDMALIGLSVSCDEFSSIANAFGVHPAFPDGAQFFSCAERLNDLRAQAERCLNTRDDIENKLLLSMLLTLYRASEKNKQTSIPPVLTNAVAMMSTDEHLKEGVNALVRLTSYSYPHLYRLIKRHYGMTPHALVLKLKLDMASQKLIHSDLSVERIAESVGFSSVSHFSTAFKEAFGVTPAKLRRRYTSVSIMKQNSAM